LGAPGGGSRRRGLAGAPGWPRGAHAWRRGGHWRVACDPDAPGAPCPDAGFQARAAGQRLNQTRPVPCLRQELPAGTNVEGLAARTFWPDRQNRYLYPARRHYRRHDGRLPDAGFQARAAGQRLNQTRPAPCPRHGLPAGTSVEGLAVRTFRPGRQNRYANFGLRFMILPMLGSNRLYIFVNSVPLLSLTLLATMYVIMSISCIMLLDLESTNIGCGIAPIAF